MKEYTLMNQLNPKKLLNSKWTAVKPSGGEKHFLISDIELDEDGAIIGCQLEAVMTRRQSNIDWRSLADKSRWMRGWR